LTYCGNPFFLFIYIFSIPLLVPWCPYQDHLFGWGSLPQPRCSW
jgi:hypothetical protein